MSDALLHRLEAVVAQLEKVASSLGGAGGSHADEKAVPRVVAAYDDLVARSYKPFYDTCARLGGIQDIGKSAEAALGGVRAVIDAACHCKKPADKDLQKLLEPIGKAVSTVLSHVEKLPPSDPFFNHHKAFAEAIILVNWVLAPGPEGYILEYLAAADFYLNKVLVAAKGAGEPDQHIFRDFVNQLKALINETAAYAKEHFKMGLIWNAKGVDLKDYHPGHAPAHAPATPAGVPPPPAGAAPPPPPPVGALPDLSSPNPAPAAAGGAAGMAAVFGEISKGEGVTSGLKKVTADMKSKNITAPPLQPKAKEHAAAPTAKKAADVAKPPSLELRQGTWFCEYYTNDVEIKDIEMKQSVYVLKAKNCSVSIPEKCKSIQLDGCSKARVVFNQVISSFEAVNCDRLSIVISENCPSIAIDKCSGIQIILSENSVKNPPNIVTSNATELNLVVPGAKPEDDPIELPLPHQFITLYKDGKVITEPVSHSGA